MQIARNSFLTLLSAVVPAVVMLVTVPFFLQTIGTARYGVLAVFWLILLYAGQADFGLSRALTRRVAEIGDADSSKRAVVFWSALSVVAVLGLILAACTAFFAAWFVAGPFDMSAELRREAEASTVLLAACVYVLASFGVTQGFLAGREKFGAFASSAILGNSAIQILPLLCAIFLSVELTDLVLATLFGRLLGLMLSVAQCWRNGIGGEGIAISRAEIVDLLQFGKWIMVSVLTRPLMVTLDRLVIASQLGAVAVAIYTIPFQVASRFQMLPQAVWQALYPRVSSLNDIEARALARQTLDLLVMGTAPVAAALICLADPLLRLWLGENLDERSIFLAQVMLASFWISSVAMVCLGYMYSRSQSRFGGVLHVLELPIYAVALLLAANAYGLLGIAAAFALRIAIDAAILAAKSGLWRGINAGRIFLALGTIAASIWLAGIFTDFVSAFICATLLGLGSAAISILTIPSDRRSAILQAVRSG